MKACPYIVIAMTLRGMQAWQTWGTGASAHEVLLGRMK